MSWHNYLSALLIEWPHSDGSCHFSRSRIPDSPGQQRRRPCRHEQLREGHVWCICWKLNAECLQKVDIFPHLCSFLLLGGGIKQLTYSQWLWHESSPQCGGLIRKSGVWSAVTGTGHWRPDRSICLHAEGRCRSPWSLVMFILGST